MPTFSTTSLVLRTYDFSEADRVLSLFTRDEGKLRALAKGIRRSQSRLAACVGLLTLAELQFHGKPNQELLLVTQGQLKTAFPRLKADLDAFGQASRMSELIDRMAPEREPMVLTFDRMVAGLGLLEQGVAPALVGMWFEIGFLDQLGYRPWLESCQVCRKEAEVMVYHTEAGGLICSSCGGTGALRISLGTRKLLEHCREWSADKLRQFQLHPQIAREAVALLDAMIRHQLGHALKSDVFRTAVKKLAAG